MCNRILVLELHLYNSKNKYPYQVSVHTTVITAPLPHQLLFPFLRACSILRPSSRTSPTVLGPRPPVIEFHHAQHLLFLSDSFGLSRWALFINFCFLFCYTSICESLLHFIIPGRSTYQHVFHRFDLMIIPQHPEGIPCQIMSSLCCLCMVLESFLPVFNTPFADPGL